MNNYIYYNFEHTVFHNDRNFISTFSSCVTVSMLSLRTTFPLFSSYIITHRPLIKNRDKAPMSMVLPSGGSFSNRKLPFVAG